MSKRESISIIIVVVMCILAVPLQAALVAQFKFDGNLLDTSGNGYLAGDGTLYGDTHYVAGKSGSALDFDGHQDFVQAMVAPDGSGGWMPQTLNSQSAVSIAMWVKMDAFPTGDTDFIASRTWTPGDHAIEFHGSVFGMETPFFILAQGDWLTEYPHQTLSNEILGDWFHLTTTYDATAGEAYMYINGVASEVVPITSGSLVTIGNYTIGGGAGFNHRYFDGQIDEVNIFDHALTSSEVSALMVPEPATMTLLALGMSTMIMRRRKQR